MTIADKLTLLASSKEAIKKKLNIPNHVPFHDYHEFMKRSDFTVYDLFAGGKQGVWYDPSDKSTLFQDIAGTVPVTKDGDPVALMRDKSGNGNHAVQTVSTARAVYKTDGILHWLAFDGVDDYFEVKPFAAAMQQPYSFVAGVQRMVTASSASLVDSAVADTRFAITDIGITNYVSAGITAQNALPAASGVKHVLTVFVSGIDSKMQSGKGAIVTANIGNNPINNILIATRDKNSRFSKNNLYGMLFVKGAIVEQGQVQDYLASKSGVTL